MGKMGVKTNPYIEQWMDNRRSGHRWRWNPFFVGRAVLVLGVIPYITWLGMKKEMVGLFVAQTTIFRGEWGTGFEGFARIG